jgi:hypothetical protein
MKILFLILCISLLYGCKSEHDIHLGNYKSIEYSKLDLVVLYLFKRINGAFVGSELKLEIDSSFIYTTCGNSMTGNWKCYNDTLFLNVRTNKFRIDSLNVSGLNGNFPPLPKDPIKFKIENEYLIQIHIITNIRYIEKLKFNLP